jgi:protein SCO1/2
MIYASDLLQSLGPLADNLTVAFVSVDPERDTPQVLKDYLANFDPRIVGLTGSPEQIAAVTKTFGVYYAPRKIEGQEDYAMDHSTAFYLVGPDGGFRRAYNLQRGADEMTTSLREAMLPKE